jgi:hypothetical protein
LQLLLFCDRYGLLVDSGFADFGAGPGTCRLKSAGRDLDFPLNASWGEGEVIDAAGVDWDRTEESSGAITVEKREIGWRVSFAGGMPDGERLMRC